jgi:hypothetical protein
MDGQVVKLAELVYGQGGDAKPVTISASLPDLI